MSHLGWLGLGGGGDVGGDVPLEVLGPTGELEGGRGVGGVLGQEAGHLLGVVELVGDGGGAIGEGGVLGVGGVDEGEGCGVVGGEGGERHSEVGEGGVVFWW